MKTIFKIILFFFSSSLVFAQWEPLNTGVNINSFYDVFCISTSNIIVVGSEGTILKSTNGGNTWVKKTSGTTNTLWKVQFPTTEIGYIFCSDGKILKTIDGGETWTPKETGLNGANYFDDLSCVDENLIFTSNLKSIDGGENWMGFNQTPNSDRIQFLNNDIGFAGEYLWKQNDWQNPQFYRTVDSGNSWQNISGLAPFYFLNENIGYYYLGGLYKTINGGENFEKLNNGVNEFYSLRDIIAVNENTIWGIVYLSMLDYDTSSRGFIKISSNGNGNYSEHILYDSNPQLDFQSIHFASENLGFAVGRNDNQGIIWRNGNGLNQTLTIQEINNTEFNIYPNPSTTEINISFKQIAKEKFSVILTDLSGKTIYSEHFLDKQKVTIKTSQFPKGNYILSLITKQKTFSQKIIIN